MSQRARSRPRQFPDICKIFARQVRRRQVERHHGFDIRRRGRVERRRRHLGRSGGRFVFGLVGGKEGRPHEVQQGIDLLPRRHGTNAGSHNSNVIVNVSRPGCNASRAWSSDILIWIHVPSGKTVNYGNALRSAVMPRRERSIDHPRFVSKRSEDTTRVADSCKHHH